MIYITGDTHGDFRHIERFCYEQETAIDDVFILLGDSGINYAVDKYEPTELFMKGLDQTKVDKATEQWLDTIDDKLDYDIWYFGHYQGNKEIDKMRMLFHKIEELDNL